MNKRIEEIEKLRRIKETATNEAIKMCNQAGKHIYGKWSINNEGLATRTCKRCSTTETLIITPEIKEEIILQDKGQQLLNYLYNTKDNSITTDDLLFYIYSIKDYLNYMDTDKLTIKINQLNKNPLENEEAFKLISMFSNSIHYFTNNIDSISDDEWEQYDELWNKISNYIYGSIIDLREKNTHHL